MLAVLSVTFLNCKQPNPLKRLNKKGYWLAYSSSRRGRGLAQGATEPGTKSDWHSPGQLLCPDFKGN